MKNILISIYQPIVFRNLKILHELENNTHQEIKFWYVTSTPIAKTLLEENSIKPEQIIIFDPPQKYSFTRAYFFIRKRLFSTYIPNQSEINFPIILKLHQFRRAVGRFLSFIEPFIFFNNVKKLTHQLPENTFDQYVSTVPTLTDEVWVFAAAKSLAIPKIAWVKALDNLTTAKFLLGNFDKYFVWNDWHRRKLTHNFGIEEHKIFIVGAPQQQYFLQCKETGNQISSKLEKDTTIANSDQLKIIYCCSALGVFAQDTDILLRLLKDLPTANITIRLHPADTSYERFNVLNDVKLAHVLRHDKRIRGQSFLEINNADELFDQLDNADICICLGSTTILDALASGTLPISINFLLFPDHKTPHPSYWYQLEHLKYLFAELDIPVADSYDDLINLIRKYGSDKVRDKELSKHNDRLKNIIGFDNKVSFYEEILDE